MKAEYLNKIYNSKIIHEPFSHFVIDNFLDTNLVDQLAEEFPAYEHPMWYNYNNPIEVKKTMNSWDRFPPATYQFFWELSSPAFSAALSAVFNTSLHADIGLNGGGWHVHGKGGMLNVHQDYSIHPKIPFERKLNIIYHISKDWDPSWGGGLELWSHDHENNKPKELIRTIDVKYNRAVIFDTTQNSWHGFSRKFTCPEGVYRKTLAMYYVQEPNATTVQDRFRARFSPTKEQEGNQEVLNFIEERTRIKR
jgi:hypothetical protein